MYDMNGDTSLRIPQDNRSSDVFGSIGPKTWKLTGEKHIFQGTNDHSHQKINFSINLCISKYPLTLRAIVYPHLSKLSNQPLHLQISVDVENIVVVLNNNDALTYCIVLFTLAT